MSEDAMIDPEYREMEDNPVFKKGLTFSVRVVNLYKCLRDERHETVMSKQILRSGTSIGANISEALASESKDDFIHKLSISLKEGNETKAAYLPVFQYIYPKCELSFPIR